jgi:hypothetical protein
VLAVPRYEDQYPPAGALIIYGKPIIGTQGLFSPMQVNQHEAGLVAQAQSHVFTIISNMNDGSETRGGLLAAWA